MPKPIDTTIFIATGALGPDEVISRNHSVLWYLGWRCLYAEVVNSRVEGKALNLENALKRMVSMTIGRLRAYGIKWQSWVQATQLRSKPKVIPPKHKDKSLLFQDEMGHYEIHTAIIRKAKELNLMH